jgi:hypothetical protein
LTEEGLEEELAAEAVLLHSGEEKSSRSVLSHFRGAKKGKLITKVTWSWKEFSRERCIFASQKYKFPDTQE